MGWNGFRNCCCRHSGVWTSGFRRTPMDGGVPRARPNRSTVMHSAIDASRRSNVDRDLRWNLGQSSWDSSRPIAQELFPRVNTASRNASSCSSTGCCTATIPTPSHAIQGGGRCLARIPNCDQGPASFERSETRANADLFITGTSVVCFGVQLVLSGRRGSLFFSTRRNSAENHCVVKLLHCNWRKPNGKEFYRPTSDLNGTTHGAQNEPARKPVSYGNCGTKLWLSMCGKDGSLVTRRLRPVSRHWLSLRGITLWTPWIASNDLVFNQKRWTEAKVEASIWSGLLEY